MTYMACKNCGCKLNTEQKKGVLTVQDVVIGPYCDECWPKIKTCSICNQPKIWKEDIQYYDTGIFICNTCKDEHVKVCGGCGEETIMNSKDPQSGLCEECFKQVYLCKYCGSYHLKEMRWLDEYGTQLHEFYKLQAMYPGIYKRYRKALGLSCFNKIKHKFKKVNVSQCKRCDTYFSSFVKNKKGKRITSYCKHCWEHYMFECGDCGQEHVKTNKTLVIHSEEGRRSYLCSRCASRYYNCENCGSTYTKKEMPAVKTGNGGNICYKCSCLSQCSRCGKRKEPTMMSPTKNLCDYCHDRLLACSKCGKHTLETTTHLGTEVFLCRRCASSKGLGKLWGYNHKPLPIVHGDSDQLIFGIENEMSCKPTVDHKKVLGKVLATYEDDFLIAKYDSSVFNGFEIVTNPMTFEYFKAIDWGPMFADRSIMSAVEVEEQNFYNEAKDKYQKWTGFHCHLSKSHFHTHHLYKFINFLYSNHGFVEEVAERKANTYCTNFPNYGEVKSSSKTKRTKDRTFIYMPNKTITVELRFFAGCHTQEMFHKNIEFIQSLYEFTFDASRNSSSKVEDYLAYVKENEAKFPYLSKFLNL